MHASQIFFMKLTSLLEVSMFKGAANAFEEAYWLLEQALKGCDRKTSQELNLSELRGNNV